VNQILKYMLVKMKDWLFKQKSPEQIKSQNVPLPETRLNEKVLSADDEGLLQTQWNTFCRLSKLEIVKAPRSLEIQKGTLVHGSNFDKKGQEGMDLDKLEKISKQGIISGELLGIEEDCETHYCADFFKCRKTQTVGDYVKDCWRIIKTGNLMTKPPEHSYVPPVHNKYNYKIAFLVSSDKRINDLIVNDAYSNPRLKSVINYLPIEDSEIELAKDGVAAILVGIPANFITGLILSVKITENSELLLKMKTLFPNANLYSAEGKLL
jgi:hypothetical protein